MRLAFIGLGAMGYLMARRLSQASDIDLVLHDSYGPTLDRAKELGARIASSVTVADADAVFTVLPADAYVSAVASQVAAVGRRGQLFADFSTIGPDTMVAVAKVANVPCAMFETARRVAVAYRGHAWA